MFKKSVFLLAVGLLSLAAYLQFCTSLPLMERIKGRQTVESVAEQIEEKVKLRLADDLNRLGVRGFPTEIVLIGLKKEQRLEVYAATAAGFRLLKTYPFTANSGQLGPKLREGDRQIPEGVYRIAHLNPNSSYYLSLKVDYPNAFDQEKTTLPNVSDMGGDIFIHGKAASIGCIPIGDEGIEEVFMLAKYAFHKGIKIIISPCDFRNKNETNPVIESVTWENELYDSLRLALAPFEKM